MMRKILVKLSGKLIGEEIFKEMIRDIESLRQQGFAVALVHGGGKTITQYFDALKLPSEFIDGLRVTNSEAIKIVEMVLAGLINKQLTRWLNGAGVPAVGISGSDANLIEAELLRAELGFVGKARKINPELIDLLWKNNHVAVIAPTGTADDQSCLNINADMSAGEIACALNVDHFFYFTDTDGVLVNEKRVPQIPRGQIAELIKSGAASGGMIPKLTSSRAAKESGIPNVKIAPWLGEGTLLKLMTDTSIGTEIL